MNFVTNEYTIKGTLKILICDPNQSEFLYQQTRARLPWAVRDNSGVSIGMRSHPVKVGTFECTLNPSFFSKIHGSLRGHQ